jgi:hypothetical protein
MCDLASLFANRAWLRRPWPFPHVVARNVFQRDFYDALTTQIQNLLNRGLSEVPAKKMFSRSIPGYDAYGLGLSSSTEGPLAIFVSPAWRDVMCRLFGISVTPYIFAGAHHHVIGGVSGWVHNDLNPVWFPRAGNGEIQTPNPELCSYRTGAGSLPESDKVEVVRAAVMIFFLLNDGWQCGDGGEVGLYTSAQTPVSNPAALCPPLNNSLIAFECTPNSFHSYLTNTRLPRTSLIMWVHRPLEEAVATFGETHLERWR